MYDMRRYVFMIRIRKSVRRRIMKYLSLTICAAIFCAVMLGIPAVAKVIPDEVCAFLASRIMKEEYARMRREFAAAYVEEESILTCEPVSLAAVLGYDYEEEPSPGVPDGVELVGTVDLRGWSGTPRLIIRNATSYNADISAMAESEWPVKTKNADLPTVLIIHTHGTEGYLPSGGFYYTEDEDYRSTDITENVVAAGTVICNALNAAGIVTVHDTVMYDEKSYTDAYTASRRAASEWLFRYPSIVYIIDVHRDAIVNSEGVNCKPICEIGGRESAQVMLLIGTDEAGADHEDWRTNLTVAAKIQQQMNTLFPGLARPISLRSASFNQQLAPGYMLLEIGSCVNTIDEAKYAAELFSESFIAAYREGNG